MWSASWWTRNWRKGEVDNPNSSRIIRDAHGKNWQEEPDLESPENGLLLRADIHTLFDLNLLWIEPDTFRVRLHPDIASSEYANLDAQTLRDHNGKPLTSKNAPSSQALRERWHAFK